MEKLKLKLGKSDGKTVYLDKVHVWYEESNDQIHLAVPDIQGFHTWISRDRKSIRCHENLYNKLAAVLRNAGVLAPAQRGSRL